MEVGRILGQAIQKSIRTTDKEHERKMMFGQKLKFYLKRNMRDL